MKGSTWYMWHLAKDLPSPQERSPDQFGAMFRTLPAMTPGSRHPSLPLSNHTIPPRLSPSKLTHRKVLNGIQEHASTGPKQQGTYLTSSTNSLSSFPSLFAVRMWTYFLFSALSEQTRDETDSVVESLTDGDSVKGLGDTTDFLNMVRDHWNFPEMISDK